MVTDEQVASLRALLSGHPDDGVRLTSRLVETGEMEGFGALIYAAFAAMVGRRFAPAWVPADIVRTVAEMRARLVGLGVEVDPCVAEALIRRALGDQVTGDFDDESKARAQVFMLLALAGDEGLNGAALDGFVAEAGTLADRLIGSTGSSR